MTLTFRTKRCSPDPFPKSFLVHSHRLWTFEIPTHFETIPQTLDLWACWRVTEFSQSAGRKETRATKPTARVLVWGLDQLVDACVSQTATFNWHPPARSIGRIVSQCCGLRNASVHKLIEAPHQDSNGNVGVLALVPSLEAVFENPETLPYA